MKPRETPHHPDSPGLSAPDPDPTPAPRAWVRPVALVGVILLLFGAAWAFGLQDRLGDLHDWLQGLGPWAPAIFVLLYVTATVAAIPGSALGVAAGALFGAAQGVALVSLASTLGASLAFLISRYWAREAVVRWLGENPQFQRLDRLTEKHGAVIVALTRLVPIFPFNLLNYGFGLTRVPFWTYVFWSWLCMLPGTALYVVGADVLTRALAQGRAPWGLVAVLLGVVALLAVLGWLAKRRLAAQESQTGTDEDKL